MEEWRDIEGYEGIYQVSNEGRVKSLNFHRQGYVRILTLNTNAKGYKRVGLSNGNGIITLHLVHRLVAKAFILNPNNYPIINHKDENPANNKVENLEWCGYQYNNTYNNRHLKCASKISESRQGFKESEETKKKISNALKGRKSPTKGNPSEKRKKIVQMSGDTIVKVWNYARETENFGFNSGHVIDCCKNKRLTHKGFIWRYV